VLATGPASARDLDAVGVVMLRWPDEAAARRLLADEGRARLLLVDADSDPPRSWDSLEDWVRVPSDPLELYARRRVLERRLAGRLPVFVDDDGLLRRGAAWVALSPTETTLVRLLLEHRGQLVGRRALLAAVGSVTVPDESRLLDRAVHRLRRRLEPFGLAIHTVRGSGFALEVGEVV
jgi:DNA-binding response OmpR family regulator